MKVFIVDLEAIDTRYTCEWKHHIPTLLTNNGFDVQVIAGPDDLDFSTTPGMFLNFSATNFYKSAQVQHMSRLFSDNKVNDGDCFLFTDAWHPGILQLRYMADLLGVRIVTAGLWHSGSYDPQDGLGQRIGNVPWAHNTELAMFNAYDYNCFATQFHIDLFKLTYPNVDDSKILLTGWPMEYMRDILSPYSNVEKTNTIIFPHRIAPEKQVDIFRDLASHLPQYEFIVCQDQQLSKKEYHQLLAKSKVVFSASKQETLGISVALEGPLSNCIPLSPDRLSYSEIFDEFQDFLYPGYWTETYANYVQYRPRLIGKITQLMNEYCLLQPKLQSFADFSTKSFFSATNLINKIKEHEKN